MSLIIGNKKLKYGLFLAPMAGVTDRTFRLICKEHGAEYTVSEMVCAKALCYEQKSKKKSTELSATSMLAHVSADEMPMSVQIFGSDPIYMAEAARMIEACSYKGCKSDCPPTTIDINMGCPMRKITANGEGSALMKNTKLASEIVSAVVGAVKIPVTVKIRSGWDLKTVNAPEFAKALEASGASMICLHARTKEQLYTPGIDLTVIEKTKNAVEIPIIGNGDIYTAKDAVEMIKKTGCDGVMIGRGSQGNPWIFSEIAAFMSNKGYIYPTVNERLQTAIFQLKKTVMDKGEHLGTAESKKHMAWYTAGLKDSAKARQEIMLAESSLQIQDILKRLIEDNG